MEDDSVDKNDQNAEKTNYLYINKLPEGVSKEAMQVCSEATQFR